jgi:hypothetical protein
LLTSRWMGSSSHTKRRRLGPWMPSMSSSCDLVQSVVMHQKCIYFSKYFAS